MQHVKKTLSKLILLCMTFVLVFSAQGIMALAADDPFATENARMKTELESIVTELKDSEKEDLSKRLQAIIDALDALDDDDDSLASAESAKDVIVSVMEDPDVMEAMGLAETAKYDKNLLIVQAAWINSFGKVIAQYGFSLNEYVIVDQVDRENSDDDHTVTYTDKDSLHDSGHAQTDADQEQAKESSKMIQKLRWGRKNNDSNVNIVGFLKRFEQNATFANVATILQSIAAALVFAFGANNLLKISTDRMASYDAVLREFAKVIFGVWFIFNYRYFTILVMRVGTYFTEIILDGATAESSQSQIAATLRYGLWKSLEETMADGSAGSLLEGVASAATNVLGYTGTNTDASTWDKAMEVIAQLFGGIGDFLGGDAIGGTIVNLAINWVVFAILIELAIRYIFTPIAIADLYSEGFHSNGMRWIKKLLSCCIAGGLIYISMYAANVLKTQLTGIHPLQTAAINLTMIGFFAKSRQIADEIVGVR